MYFACHWEASHSKCIEHGPLKSVNVGIEAYDDVLARTLHVESVWKKSMQLTGLQSM